ncbi:hypothetical protein OU798_23845 [Prolixibacteraceae bacterium Z1-6]|uniref:6-bladed beta-propeller n=1 Tax=Draconibacterium aestuarii TaxID=2998507 RepID=A0A9X3JA56_9BACT|nr:hypothetical protein [Prolixibacteraceae bacterium Z1-6]
MNFYKIILILIVFLGISCSPNTVLDEEVKTIELKESKDFLPISSFISDINYLELKVTEANVEVGEIQDIKVLDGEIIIKQRKAGESSFIRFTEKGEFINEIINNKNGKITNPLDIIPYKNGFAVLGKKGIHFVSKEGTYKGKMISSEMDGSTFFEAKNRFYTINESLTNEFLSEYSEKSKSEKVTRLNERFDRLIYSNSAFVEKGNLHLLSSCSDIIYSYASNKLLPKYKLDGGIYPTLNEVWQNVGDLDPKETMRYIYDTQHILVKNYLENDAVIFLTYWVGSSSTTAIIKKANWEIRYYGHGVNDIDGGIWDKPLYLSSNSELYIPISAAKITGHKITNKWHNDFKHVQTHIAATGNPLIMRCKLK